MLNWPAVPDQYHGIVTSSQPVVEAPPQLLMSTAFPCYGNVDKATAFCPYCGLNNNWCNEVVVKADPLFFNKGYCYNYINDDMVELADDHCGLSYPRIAITITPTATVQQQQLLSGPGRLSLYDNDTVNADQFYHCRVPPDQPPNRDKPCCFDLPDLLFPQGNMYPAVQPPVLHSNGVSCKPVTIVEPDVERSKPRLRRVSAQSLAARERQKRIADKTHELGKLIPGGTKMNTAGMLQSAFNYVKFLQSQVHILQLLASFDPCQVQENDPVEEVDKEKLGRPANVLGVVASVQEKLYKEGSCIIPPSLAESLIHHHPRLQNLLQLL
ncbi:hypothetical protein CRG98_011548 [Punica granatum]|nr:hypothetical protein CRG98_011548 [Punica granatum]